MGHLGVFFGLRGVGALGAGGDGLEAEAEAVLLVEAARRLGQLGLVALGQGEVVVFV